MNIFKNANLTYTGGMLPVRWDLSTGQPSDSLSNSSDPIISITHLS
jgi:hypothetical protein